jgi:hypothetical protein
MNERRCNEQPENKWWLNKYVVISAAIISTSTIVGGVYAFEIKPKLDEEIKKEVGSCQVEFKKDLDEKLDAKFKLVMEGIKEVKERVVFIDTSLTPRVDKIAAVQWMTTTKKERDAASDYYKNVMGGK